jgi:hypothetical protein
MNVISSSSCCCYYYNAGGQQLYWKLHLAASSFVPFFYGFSPTYKCTSSWPTTEDLQKKLKHELWLSRHLWAYVAQNLVLGYAIHPPVTAGHAPPYVVTGGITTSPPLLKLWLVWKLMTGGDKVIRWEDDSDGNRQWLAWLAAVLTVFSPAGRVRAVRADDFYTNLACVCVLGNLVKFSGKNAGRVLRAWRSP